MLTLQHRIHFNAFHLSFYRALHSVREGAAAPPPDMTRILETVCALRRPDMGPNLLASLVVSCRMVAPLVLTEGSGQPVPHELQERMIQAGAGATGQEQEEAAVAARALFYAYVNDRLALASALQACTGPEATARVWAMALMALASSMAQYCPSLDYGAEHISLECPGCPALIGSRHVLPCSYALCSRSGQPMASCAEPRHCSVTVWEGKPTGWDTARREGLWCVDTGQGPVACGEEEEEARPWWEGVRAVLPWRERHQTWG